MAANDKMVELLEAQEKRRPKSTLEKQASVYEVQYDSAGAATKVRPEAGGEYVLLSDVMYFAPFGRDISRGAQFTINDVEEIERLLGTIPPSIAEAGSPAARAAQGELDEHMVRNMPGSIEEAKRQVAAKQAQLEELQRQRDAQQGLSDEYEAARDDENRPTVATPQQRAVNTGQSKGQKQQGQKEE